MTTINLRDYYLWYIQDEHIEVYDEVAAELADSKRCKKRAAVTPLFSLPGLRDNLARS